MLNFYFLFSIFISAFCVSFDSNTRWNFNADVLNHDSTCFTQGLEFLTSNIVIESCGLYGRSRLRKWDVQSDLEIFSTDLPPTYFAEGLTIIDGKYILMLTWREKKILWFDVDSFQLIKSLEHNHEGYGLAWNPKDRILYATNSTHYINHFTVDTDEKIVTFVKSVPVFDDRDVPIHSLNELEYSIETGLLLSNIWQRDEVVFLNPDDGTVHSWMDLRSLPRRKTTGDVLNGLALRRSGENVDLYATGKFWSDMFVVQVPAFTEITANAKAPSTVVSPAPSVTEEKDSHEETKTGQDSIEKDSAADSSSKTNSSPFEASFRSLARLSGFCYVVLWTISWYPQFFLNRRTKSVAGMSLDTTFLNVVGFFCYSVFTWGMYYLEMKHNFPKAVELSDVAFSTHAFIICCAYVYQSLIYNRGGQTVSKPCKITIALILIMALVIMGLGLAGLVPWHPFSLWLTEEYKDWQKENTIPPVLSWSCLSYLGMLKAGLNVFKYIPQVLLNVTRQSTDGMEISQYIMDFSGGLASIMENVFDALASSDWSYVSGNIPKFIIASCSMFYDVILMIQHFCLYKGKRPLISQTNLSTEDARVLGKSASMELGNTPHDAKSKKKKKKAGFQPIPTAETKEKGAWDDLSDFDDDSLMLQDLTAKGILKFDDSNHSGSGYGSAGHQERKQKEDAAEAYYGAAVTKLHI
eukprot:GDKJ01014260.1.p1 GENE.GDKJ01014260.1~~GDKJ01014260.1.p1  ORF type:complete len:693 (+),score=96.33 GDKJ01014260.1:38-2116(+)